MHPRLVLLAVLIATAAIYWSGLSGPFIFDDGWNLEPLQLWQAGQASWQEILFRQESLVASRPVSMASFLLSTWLGGTASFSFKLGNLVIHLCCGVLGWLVLHRVLNRDPRLAPHAELFATLVAIFWLLHPLHVSTVLYAVQRMAQLSTLFALVAVLIYLVARQWLIDGYDKSARALLFIAFPSAVLLGLLSKQNAAAAPALCLVFELAYFAGQARHRRTILVFFGFSLALPLLAGIALLSVAPEKLLAGYSEWDFTLWERLLTQARALMDYIGMLLIPRGPLMGLYTDDFAVSTELLSPVSTLLSIIALCAISMAVIVLRKRAPSVFAGWFFFLVAHGVESSFLPLEMYYEHRNYFPSMGLMLAVVGLCALVPRNIRTNVVSLRQLGLIGATGFALVLGVATLGRVLIWKDMDAIMEQGIKYHPDSLRARFDMSSWALQRENYEVALDSMRHLARSDDPRHRQLGNLSIAAINCMRGDNAGNQELLQRAAAENLPRLTTYEAQSFMRLNIVSRTDGCGPLGQAGVAGYLKQIMDSAADQPESATPKWFARYVLAEMYARSDMWREAQAQAELAWNAGRDQKVGALLMAIYVHNNRLGPAEDLLAELNDSIKPYDMGGQQALIHLRRLLVESAKKQTSSIP